jgi:group I intron endonuclease
MTRRYRTIIYNALLKYGHSSFTLEILDKKIYIYFLIKYINFIYCNESDLLERETYYIRLLKPSYNQNIYYIYINLLQQAGSLLGFKHSQATLAKMRARKHNEVTREKMRLARLGRKLSETILLKLRGQKRSEVSREKMRLARLGRSHSAVTLAKLRGRS